MVATSKTSAALTETATITGGMVTIPADATSVVIKAKSAWTAGNYVKLGDKYYVVDADNIITVPVTDLKALSDKNLSNATEVTSYAVTMSASGVTATWALGNAKGDVTNGSKVPQGATVTLADLDGKYYVQTITGTYTKENGTFAMPGSTVDLAKKYVSVAQNLTVVDTDVTDWPTKSASDVKITASVPASTYAEIGGSGVTVTLALSDTPDAAPASTIEGSVSCDTAVITGGDKADIMDDSGTTLDKSTFTVYFTSSTSADVTLTLNLNTKG